MNLISSKRFLTNIDYILQAYTEFTFGFCLCFARLFL